jgi:two-component system, sensor histidine kinase and response regulator
MASNRESSAIDSWIGRRSFAGIASARGSGFSSPDRIRPALRCRVSNSPRDRWRNLGRCAVWRGLPIDRSGQAVRVVGVNEDITDRISANRRLQSEEAKFRGLFERSPVGIAMNDFQTGEFLEFNRATNEPAGYTPEEFRQLSYWDLTPTEYLSEEQKILESLKANGSYGPFQKEYIRKDGSRYPVLLNGFRAMTPEGRDVIWSIIQDISAIQEAQREIYDREQRLQQLAEQSRTVTWEVDAQGLYTYLSPVAEIVWGYTPDEIVGRRYFYDLHPEPGREAFRNSALQAIARQMKFQGMSTRSSARMVR